MAELKPELNRENIPSEEQLEPQGAEFLKYQQARAERRVEPGFPDDNLAEKASKLIHAEDKFGAKPGIETSPVAVDESEAFVNRLTAPGADPVVELNKALRDNLNTKVGKTGLPGGAFHRAIRELSEYEDKAA